MIGKGSSYHCVCPLTLQLVDTTVEIANKVGAAEITSRIVEDLKDENEPYRKMVMDCIEKVGVVWNGESEWIYNNLQWRSCYFCALNNYLDNACAT